MKNRYLFNLAALACSAAALGSCVDMMQEAHDAKIVEPISVAVQIKAVTGFVDSEGNGEPDPNIETSGLKVRFVNYDEDFVTETTTDEDGIAVAEVTPGNYTISVTGSPSTTAGMTTSTSLPTGPL